MTKKSTKKRALASIHGELPAGGELSAGDELEPGSELEGGTELAGVLGSFARQPSSSASAPSAAFSGASGDDILSIARQHLGEAYVLGARAPMANATWSGPWDCAEFASWCVYRASQVLFGTEPRNDPMLADAYTGFWFDQARASGSMIDWREAAGIAGAAVLRRPVGQQIGHIVLSDGLGGTIEAHSTLRGVIAGTVSARRWDCGILVPGIRYLRSETPPPVIGADGVVRLTQPLTRGDAIRVIQQRLIALGFMAGTIDGIYGPQTAHAVRAFQASKGLVADGEVGALTRKALGIG